MGDSSRSGALLGAAVESLVRETIDRVLSERVPTTDPDDPLVELGKTELPRKSWAKAIRSGELPARKIGRGFFARRSDLDKWIESQPSARQTEPGDRDDQIQDPIAAALASGRLRKLDGGRSG